MKNITKKSISEDFELIQNLHKKYIDAIYDFKEGTSSKSNFENQRKLIQLSIADIRTGLYIASLALEKLNDIKAELIEDDICV